MTASFQLYLCAPASLAGEAGRIVDVLAATGAPSLLIMGEGDPARLSACVAAAHRQNATVLTDSRDMLAAVKGFDGLHLPIGGLSVKDARALVGDQGVVGARCALSRHEAMTLAEAGADYVTFCGGDETVDDIAEMAAWWSGLIEVPCVLRLPAGAEDAAWRVLALAGADFLMPGPEIWDGPDAVIDRLGRMGRV